MTTFDSQLELHTFFLHQGFDLRDDVPTPEVLCEDWKHRGECASNPTYMNQRCARHCADDAKPEL